VCTNRFYAQDAIYDEFVRALAARAAQLKVGSGFETGVQQGPLIDEAALAKVQAHVADAVSHGARVVVGGHRHPMGGTYYEPTVLADVSDQMILAREETFGPVAPVFRFRSEADVIESANRVEYGLAAYFYTRDLSRALRVAERLEFGMVGLNTGIISTEVAPFGGVKQSGFGREGSHHGIEEYLVTKYVCIGGV
jgi:succinate-semialdehyde dehydrogenase/glutarate-semialdehyde dehydrogenase